jgi:hypothetical protein
MKLRHEEKYKVRRSQFNLLKPFLDVYLNIDLHCGHMGYHVRSLYFDTLYDHDFGLVLNGVEKRKKIRIRMYDFDPFSLKLEVKEKYGIHTNKIVYKITKEEADLLIDGKYEWMLNRSDSLKLLYYEMKTMGYYPKIIIDYMRTAYIYDLNDIRITFDSHVSSTIDTRRFYINDYKVESFDEEDEGVIEIKYEDFLLDNIKDALELINQVPTSNSKYVTSRIDKRLVR